MSAGICLCVYCKSVIVFELLEPTTLNVGMIYVSNKFNSETHVKLVYKKTGKVQVERAWRGFLRLKLFISRTNLTLRLKCVLLSLVSVKEVRSKKLDIEFLESGTYIFPSRS